MSKPYGQPPAAPQPEPASAALNGLGSAKVLPPVAGVLGLVIYLLAFSDGAGGYLRGLLGVLLLGGGLLAAAAVLPKAPATLVPATVLVVTGTLFLLIDVAKSPAFFGPASGLVQTPGLVVVALVLAFLQSAVCLVALLVETGVVKPAPRVNPFPRPLWSSQQPGGYPGPSAPSRYPGSSAPGFTPQQPYPPEPVQYQPPQGPAGSQPGPYGAEPGAPGHPGPPDQRRDPSPGGSASTGQD
ncbi:MAG TPA: DUF5336 domain-containing protein [Pseudonocardiaceae bacterium]|jgi:hypothetical protein|nr:DUF5336 domain-containing protein [Pseudonocardiaceae bacterium]